MVSVFGSGFGRSAQDIASVRICDKTVDTIVDKSVATVSNSTAAWLSPGEMAVALPPGVVSCEVLIESAAGLEALSGSSVIREPPSIEVARPSYVLAGDGLSSSGASVLACGTGLFPRVWQTAGASATGSKLNASLVSMSILGIDCASIVAINSSCIRCDLLSGHIPSDVPVAGMASAMQVRSGDRSAEVSTQVFTAVSRPTVATLSPPQLPKDLDEAVLCLGTGFGDASDDLGALYLLLEDAGSGALNRLAANLASEGPGS